VNSEFVLFLDNDDLLLSNALALLTRMLDEHPECPAAHGVASTIDLEGRQPAGDNLTAEMLRRRELSAGQIIPLPLTAPTSFQSLLLKNYPLTPGTTLVRRRTKECVGEFLPEAVPCDDWDMNLRIARYGPLAFTDQVVLNWRRHPGAASHTTRRWRSAYLLVRRRSVRSRENTEQHRVDALAAFRLECQTILLTVARDLSLGQFGEAGRKLSRWALFQIAYCLAAWRSRDLIARPRRHEAITFAWERHHPGTLKR
jgi:hypothetical protein